MVHVNWRVVESARWVTREKPITPCTCLKVPGILTGIRALYWSMLLIFLPTQLMGSLIDNYLFPCVGRIDNNDLKCSSFI